MSSQQRPSPFARPTTPSTLRAQSPHPSPTKDFATTSSQHPSPMLSPERSSSFVRRPSQLGSQRAQSPFARPASRLSVAESQDVEKPTRSDDRVDSIPFNLPKNSITQADGPTAALHSPATSPLERPAPVSQPSTRPPPVQRTVTASSTATIRPDPAPQTRNLAKPTGFGHVPQPLLHTMRESFEVLDAANKGTIAPPDLANMLEQLGHDSSRAALATYFSPQGPQTLNLARFLDGLSTPLKDMSEPDELLAAFGAFDVDDSGQIDLAELREALLSTVPESQSQPRLSEAQVDDILDEFRGRRAFGAKGLLGKELGSASRSDVFRYRDFMSAITGAAAINV